LLLFCGVHALAAAADAPRIYTAVTNSNVRAAPTTNSQKVGFLSAGKQVRVVGSAAGGNWYQVRLDSGQMGFVYGNLLQTTGAVEASSEQRDLVGGPSPAPADAFAYIVWPNNGEVIPGGDFVVIFGLHNMGTAPAGVEKQNTGHHHLLIDTDLPPLDKPIPSDDHHVHFGRGQTEYQIRLPPGDHTLQLLLGDANHVPHTPPVMSERIRVQVQ
jgi:uncharacterized protein YgiM (DUF1202 family)